jgi:hypothetical protein
MARRRRRNIATLSFLLLTVPCHAGGRIYAELGAGVSQIRDSAALFGPSTPTAIGLGLAGQLSAAYEVLPSGGGQLISLHLGAQYRYATGYSSINQQYYGLQSLYPMLRIEGNHRAHLSLGWTPFLLARNTDHSGFDSYSKPIGAWAMMAEIGYQSPLTPAVSFVPTLAVQAVRAGGTYGPKPSIEGAIAMRFFIDAGTSFDNNSSPHPSESRKYEGWRYPFGLEAPK